ncbi:alpha/beta hydrolase family protein [Saccharicrinis aurantiacus]|uniref:hypothetical protein n=1 Tax=Saccharicrinis aurantiacus TaxID=1849719 RepID=UPI001115344E|nr:hypothetical protein [Saccharicrinis aurantiacus]
MERLFLFRQQEKEYQKLTKYMEIKRIVFVVAVVIGTCLTSIAQILTVPEMEPDKPAAGKRVKVIPPEYENTDVYYSIYLPSIYKVGNQYPVIVEYTGNYFPPTASTGEVKDANLAYALAEELGAIWIVLPYVEKGQSILKWWGNEEETINYALTNIPRVCKEYGGNEDQIFICGFSRGAIAVNYLGLYNDEIAELWCGFFSHDHYDGQQEWRGKEWGSPLKEYRAQAKMRMKRMNGRPALISSNGFDNDTPSKEEQYIIENNLDQYGTLSFIKVPIPQLVDDFPNEEIPHAHTDKWMLYNSSYKEEVISWFKKYIK